MPNIVFLLPVVIPLLLVGGPTEKENTEAWSYHGLTPAPLDVVFTLLVYGLTTDVWVALVATVLFAPLYRTDDALKAWPWATAGVMLGLALAWSGALSIGVAGVILLAFVLPWLLAPQEEDNTSVSLTQRKHQQRIALWGSVVLVSLYLVLTWALC